MFVQLQIRWQIPTECKNYQRSFFPQSNYRQIFILGNSNIPTDFHAYQVLAIGNQPFSCSGKLFKVFNEKKKNNYNMFYFN